MPRAFVIGGTGLIGQAIGRRLLSTGWDVVLTGRDPSHMPQDLTTGGARFMALNRSDVGSWPPPSAPEPTYLLTASVTPPPMPPACCPYKTTSPQL